MSKREVETKIQQILNEVTDNRTYFRDEYEIESVINGYSIRFYASPMEYFIVMSQLLGILPAVDLIETSEGE